ncbi:MAG: YhbD family protein [Coriobacteriia bacterium]|nr:YhbD family protein [Coriobacteriia bacterium]MDR2714163.1 YhbD family protein [Coriobacteriales bacterium]
MDNQLISKKELLEQTGISYGQLYRWKRERLLPEDWFIKQSSYTGQETFFPRTQVLERIGAIKELKDTHSLEMIAGILSPQMGTALAIKELASIIKTDANYLDEVIVKLSQMRPAKTGSSDKAGKAAADSNAKPNENSEDLSNEYLSFSEAVFVAALGTLVERGTLFAPAAVSLALQSRALAPQWTGDTMNCDVLMVSESESTKSSKVIASWHLILYKQGEPPAFSKEIIAVANLPLEEASAAIKRTLKQRQEQASSAGSAQQ